MERNTFVLDHQHGHCDLCKSAIQNDLTIQILLRVSCQSFLSKAVLYDGKMKKDHTLSSKLLKYMVLSPTWGVSTRVYLEKLHFKVQPLTILYSFFDGKVACFMYFLLTNSTLLQTIYAL